MGPVIALKAGQLSGAPTGRTPPPGPDSLLKQSTPGKQFTSRSSQGRTYPGEEVDLTSVAVRGVDGAPSCQRDRMEKVSGIWGHGPGPRYARNVESK